MFYTDRYKIARGATPDARIAGRRWAWRLQSLFVRFSPTEQKHGIWKMKR